MPQLLQHIDAIARQKQRDVLFVAFGRSPGDLKVDWRNLPVRQQIIDWLNENGMTWQECSHVASENCMMSYLGQIYINVPFDTGLPEYQKLAEFLEREDGTPCLAGAFFCYLPLSIAMKNAHHDEPGFWEKWAENF